MDFSGNDDLTGDHNANFEREDAKSAMQEITPDPTTMPADGGDGDLDEDGLFCATSGGGGSSDTHIPPHTYDVYDLRSNDPEIYRKTASILRDMAGLTIPPFILQILQLRYEKAASDEDQSRRLHFEVDNKIIKSLQAMHRAQICDRVKGFDLKLAKVMGVLLQHYQEGVKEAGDDVLEELVPKWPDEMCCNANNETTAEQWKKRSKSPENRPKISAAEDEAKDEPKAAPLEIVRQTESPCKDYLSASTMASSVGQTASSGWAGDSAISALARAREEETRRPALEYGLTFDIFAPPDSGSFSVYVNPNFDYSAAPKEAPLDPDQAHSSGSQEDGRQGGSDTSSQIWRQLKLMSTRVSRTLRNPQYFVTLPAGTRK